MSSGASGQASERMSAAERESKGSSVEQANEWAVRADERADESMTHYSPRWSHGLSTQCVLISGFAAWQCVAARRSHCRLSLVSIPSINHDSLDRIHHHFFLLLPLFFLSYSLSSFFFLLFFIEEMTDEFLPLFLEFAPLLQELWHWTIFFHHFNRD